VNGRQIGIEISRLPGHTHTVLFDGAVMDSLSGEIQLRPIPNSKPGIFRIVEGDGFKRCD